MTSPGGLIVVVDMSLAMMSVLTNLMVITSIRRIEEFVCPATYMSAKSQQELEPLVAAWETRIHKGKKDPGLCQ